MVTELTGRRLGVLAGITVVLFASLIARLWFLQVMSAPEFQEVAAENRTRDVVVESPRGRIFDAKGRVLADRRESRVVTLDWSRLSDLSSDEREAVFLAVAAELNVAGIKTKVSDLVDEYERARTDSLKPVIIAEDIDNQLWVSLQEKAFAGFTVEQRFVRVYPYGEVAAHILGYTGPVGNQEEADQLNVDNDEKEYLPGDELGVAGIERILEQSLRGVPEIRRVEIDAQNRVIGTAEILRPGIAGDDVHLTIDIDLQFAAEQILQDELRLARARDACDGCRAHVAEAGSLVALDVNDGSVVALASYPTFDPGAFVFGISAEQFAFLRDRPDEPFLDRATRGLYPAGSTFKPVTAYASLTTGARSESEIWQDTGTHLLDNCVEAGSGCLFRNAGSVALGPVDLRAAIERSSDTYFYSLGEKFWVESGTYGPTIMQETAVRFGYGASTGIRLPDEADGRVPTAENRIEEFGSDSRPWSTGDNVNLAIGQGDLLITPLQLANSYAALATGGTRYQPRLVDRTTASETGETTLEFKVITSAEDELEPQALTAIRDGLFRVPVSGTAARAFFGFPLDSYPLAGKTGTAQVAGKADFSLFAAFGPGLQPQYSVAAVLEEAGFGSDAAAPAVRRFYEHLGGFEPAPPAPLAGGSYVPSERPFIPDDANQEPPAEPEAPVGDDGEANS